MKLSAVRRTTTTTVLAASLVGALALSGCAKSEDDASDKGSAAGDKDSGQVVATPGADDKTCDLTQFGGAKTDLKSATVGFSQSEKEANPFRIAETASIKVEAKARGSPCCPPTPRRSSPSRSATSRT